MNKLLKFLKSWTSTPVAGGTPKLDDSGKLTNSFLYPAKASGLETTFTTITGATSLTGMATNGSGTYVACDSTGKKVFTSTDYGATTWTATSIDFSNENLGAIFYAYDKFFICSATSSKFKTSTDGLSWSEVKTIPDNTNPILDGCYFNKPASTTEAAITKFVLITSTTIYSSSDLVTYSSYVPVDTSTPPQTINCRKCAANYTCVVIATNLQKIIYTSDLVTFNVPSGSLPNMSNIIGVYAIINSGGTKYIALSSDGYIAYGGEDGGFSGGVSIGAPSGSTWANLCYTSTTVGTLDKITTYAVGNSGNFGYNTEAFTEEDWIFSTQGSNNILAILPGNNNFLLLTSTQIGIATSKTSSSAGIVKPNEQYFTIGADGELSLNTSTKSDSSIHRWATQTQIGVTEYILTGETLPSDSTSVYQLVYGAGILNNSNYILDSSTNKLTLLFSPTTVDNLVLEYWGMQVYGVNSAILSDAIDSTSSTNAASSKAVSTLNTNKQEKLTAGSAITIDSSTNTISANTATSSTLGVVMPDNDTIQINSDGELSMKFTQTGSLKTEWITQSATGVTTYSLGTPTLPSSTSSDYIVFYGAAKLNSADFTIDTTLSKITLTNIVPVDSRTIAVYYFGQAIVGWNRTASVIKDTTSTSVTLNIVKNTAYIYSTLTSLTIPSFPTNCQDGDEFAITFISGSTATTLSVSTTGADFNTFVPAANKTIEVSGRWYLDRWIVVFCQVNRSTTA